jgi:RNA polymerase sigma-70 factor (ECF subfamily)
MAMNPDRPPERLENNVLIKHLDVNTVKLILLSFYGLLTHKYRLCLSTERTLQSMDGLMAYLAGTPATTSTTIGGGEWEIDAQLMLRVKEGKEECFEQLAARHRRRLIHWLFRMVQDRAIAEELAQEVFLRVYLSRANYQPTARFTTWLYRIANNRALNWIRDHADETQRESLDATPLRGLRRQFADANCTIADRMLDREAETEFQQTIRNAIIALPERQRAAVLMHKYDGMEYTQIAEALDCNVSTVKSILWRAYTTLRTRLSPLALNRQR